MFEIAVGLASIAAGAVAAIVGFGIGSLLTPLVSLQLGIKLGVAAVAVPHVLGTALRFWLVRRDVDRRLLLHFGVWSAAGGLTGAALQSIAGNPVLAVVFGGLLLFVGATQLTGYADRMRFGRRVAWVAGALSGFLGGLVGNQGGIRSAALLGFEVSKGAFVATSTAIGLVVDGGRLPVYLATQGDQLAQVAPLIALMSAGVLAGTVVGTWALRRVPERLFRRVVAVALLALGLFTLSRVGG